MVVKATIIANYIVFLKNPRNLFAESLYSLRCLKYVEWRNRRSVIDAVFHLFSCSGGSFDAPLRTFSQGFQVALSAHRLTVAIYFVVDRWIILHLFPGKSRRFAQNTGSSSADICQVYQGKTCLQSFTLWFSYRKTSAIVCSFHFVE